MYNYSKTHKIYKNCPKINIFFLNRIYFLWGVQKNWLFLTGFIRSCVISDNCEESCIFLKLSALNADYEIMEEFSGILLIPSNSPSKIDAN